MNRGAVVALLIGLQAILLAAHADPPEAKQPERLRVMTYNIHQGWPVADARPNLEAVADVLRAADAHIIALQETETSRITSGHVDATTWLAHELGMHAYAGPPASAGVYGVSILSAWPLTETSWSYLPNPESVERVLVTATAQSPHGPVRVHATHFGIMEVPVERLEQATAVAAAARGERAIVLGDFNTQPGESPYHVLTSNLQDAWVAAHGDEPGFTMTADDPQYRIDHVFVRGWGVTDARLVGGPEASDHLAVVADLAG